MKIDVKKIDEGEESIVIRYKERAGTIGKIVDILDNTEDKLWGKADNISMLVNKDDILYLESVDDRVFAYTLAKVFQIDKSLTSFMADDKSEVFFRCSKSMIINVNHVTSLKSLSSNRIDATLEGGEHIIISRRYASEFRRLLKGER